MKKIGKIKKIDFAHGGYQDAAFGLSITFSGRDEEGEEWKAYYFDGPWATWMECPKNAKWIEQDRTRHFGVILRKVNNLVNDAKVKKFSELRGIPVEVELKGSHGVENFRILKEAL